MRKNKMLNRISTYLAEVKAICDLISKEDINRFITEIVKVKEQQGRVFFVGVGGSAANASHAVNDFRKILQIESYAITDNVAELTARINDDSWESSYSEWLKISKLNDRDVIVVFSVGGGSPLASYNICEAIDYAISTKSKVLSIVSRDGGHAKLKSDVCVLIPIIDKNRITPHAEEWQAIIWHMLIGCLTTFGK